MLGGLTAVAAVAAPDPARSSIQALIAPERGAMRRALKQAGAPDHLSAFYRARDYRPLWWRGRALRPEAERLIDALRLVADEGLDPGAYFPDRLSERMAQAQHAGHDERARVDLALTAAMADYLSGLHRPPSGEEMIFTDTTLPRPPGEPDDILRAAGAAPDLGAYLTKARRMNVIYEGLRAGLAAARAGGASHAAEAAILANMDRARALPADLGSRFILVQVGGARLDYYEGGRLAGSMKVVVGRPDLPTPVMAGVIRHLVFNPYWNVPPDLVRDRIAPQALADRAAGIEQEGFEVLSDWSEHPRRLEPRDIDWRAVAAGRIDLRVRQRPGPNNMLGAVKFMLPNRLGIYLHDTPQRSVFGQAHRPLSAGCVRLEDARTLYAWMGVERPTTLGPGELVVPLKSPVPVYFIYLTVEPSAAGLVTHPDVYGRDRPVLAAVAEG